MSEEVSTTDEALPARRPRDKVHVGRTNTAILNGTEDLSIWSDEELRRGQRKSKRGAWEGRPPAVVPKKLHDELVRRTMDAATAELRDNLVDAVKLLGTVIRDPEAANSDRIKAAQVVIDKLLPKQMQLQVNVNTFSDRVEELEAAIGDNDQLRRVKERLQPRVIEGEVEPPAEVEQPWQEQPDPRSPSPTASRTRQARLER